MLPNRRSLVPADEEFQKIYSSITTMEPTLQKNYDDQIFQELDGKVKTFSNLANNAGEREMAQVGCLLSFCEGKFKHWLSAPSSAVLFVEGENRYSKMSASSLLSLLLFQELQQWRGGRVLYSASALHQVSDQRHNGPIGIMRDLVAQVLYGIPAVSEEDRRRFHESCDLQDLLSMFISLLQTSGEDKTWYCIIDGVNLYEMPTWSSQMKLLVTTLLEEREHSKVGQKNLFKLLFTSTGTSKFIRHTLSKHDVLEMPQSSIGFTGCFSVRALEKLISQFSQDKTAPIAIKGQVITNCTVESVAFPENKANTESLHLFDDFEDGEYNTDRAKKYAERWFHRLNSTVHNYFPLDDRPVDIRRVRVAILDTGIDRTHSSFRPRARQERILKTENFLPTTDSKIPGDLVGHGTHTADILSKVAPEADLLIARISLGMEMDVESAGNIIAKAIRWAIQEEVDIINMSFGFRKFIPVVDKAILDARCMNIVMFAAASNDGALEGRSFPAKREEEVICISATDGIGRVCDINPPAIIHHTSFATLGQAINVASPRALGKGPRVLKTGTSFSTPVAAGIAALFIEYARLHQGDTELENRLKDHSGMVNVFRNFSVDIGSGFKWLTPWKMFDGDASHAFDRLKQAVSQID